MQRSEFIDILTSSTPEELNKFIESKGKQAKPVCPVIFHKINDNKDGNKKQEG